MSTCYDPCRHREHNRSTAVQDDSPSRKRKLDESISDKEQTDGEPQKKVPVGPVASPDPVNSTGIVGEEN